jgi:hypothetical protein
MVEEEVKGGKDEYLSIGEIALPPRQGRIHLLYRTGTITQRPTISTSGGQIGGAESLE